MTPRRSRQSGFTLIELMVALMAEGRKLGSVEETRFSIVSPFRPEPS